MNNKIEIKLPIELFDSRSLKINDTLNSVSFSFRKDLIEYCKELKIPTIIHIDVNYRSLEKHAIRTYDNKKNDFFLLRDELSYKYVGKPYDSSFDIMKVIDAYDAGKLMSSLKKSYYSSPKIELSDVLDLYGIKIPEHLLEKYLMIKLAV